MCPDLREKAASVSIVTLENTNDDDNNNDNNNNNNSNNNDDDDNNVSNFTCKQDPEIRYNPNYFEYHLQLFSHNTTTYHAITNTNHILLVNKAC